MAREVSGRRLGMRHRAPAERGPSAAEPSLDLIAEKLDRLTWRHVPWGVDEREAWHVIRRLDEMYRQLYREQRAHYEALLEEAARQFREPSAAPAETPRAHS